MEKLSHKELQFYSRHINLQDVGYHGQQKLKNARVLVIGAGGLGCPALQYLAAAGVGHIGIVDHDIIEISNLQRQILFSYDEVGQSKANVAKQKITALNPFISVEVYPYQFKQDNAFELIENYDVIIDATDNFSAKYLINDACYFLKKPLVYASISQFEGQLSVFNVLKEDDQLSTNYRDLFPKPTPQHLVQNCAEAGVLGVLPGLLGSFQANETIKIITGIGKPLVDKLLFINTQDMTTKVFKLKKKKANPLSGENPSITSLKAIETTCKLTVDKDKVIDYKCFKKLMSQENSVQLIDVREPHEHEMISMGGKLIPLAELEDSLDAIDMDTFTVIHCKSGVRSLKAVKILEPYFKDTPCLSLEGGIEAYLKDQCPMT